MKLTATENIEAPIGFVYAALADFENWERSALRRGAEVERLDRLRQPGAGMEWKVGFDYRAKKRHVEIKLLTLTPGQTLVFDCMGQPAEAILKVELAEMGPRRTRVVVEVEVKPRTLAARLFLQSLRLAKAKVNRRFALRLAQTAADIEDRYKAQAKT
ncbi:SRPBCC family protein [Pseudorhodobacter sp.]|uniref:SRPBCC family protein n=1 Tax=Pseudorhodobacter sp. TaxID=1934400 RepID=UPI002AFF9A90|nr:SRPBCC family protein [Pseudorhodobacter sp.]